MPSWVNSTQKGDCSVLEEEAKSSSFDPNEVFGPSSVTALGFAIVSDCSEAVCVLLQRGADVNLNFAGRSPLEHALERGKFRVIKVLVDCIGVGARETLETCAVIDCSNLGLEYLPLWIGWMCEGTKLKLKGNPLSYVPEGVKVGGSKSVLQYMREINTGTGKTLWSHVNIMVLGGGGVGKTHLFQRVRGNKKYSANIATNGIDINSFSLNGIPVHWFDFGGQEVFHRFFLSPCGVYVVVFRMDEPDSKTSVSYWLGAIRSIARDPKRPAKVVVVGTHADSVQSSDERKRIWDRIDSMMQNSGNVVGFISVSNKTGEGVEDLVAGLGKAIKLAKIDKIEIPNYFMQVEIGILENKTKRPKISFAELATEHPQLSAFQLRLACQFLHNFGECFFNDSLGLVVTDMMWLVDTFKALLPFKNRWVKDGVVFASELKHVWPNAANEEIREVISVLQKLQIAFPKVEEGRWVVHCMLAEKARGLSKLKWKDGARMFERIFCLHFVPMGIMGRIIARTQGMSEIVIEEMWRNGVRFQAKHWEEYGEVVMEGSSLILRCVISNRGMSVVQRLTEECAAVLSTVFSYSEHAPYKMLITCPHCLLQQKENPLRIEMDECERMIFQSEKTYGCDGDTLNVAVLGDDIFFGNVNCLNEVGVNVFAEPFATGGFGKLYKATLEQKVVVVKKLRAKGREGLCEFRREISTMSKLDNPHIVFLHGIMLNPLRIVMEHCPGGDLLQAIRDGKLGPCQVDGANRLPVYPLAWKVIGDVAKGMTYLHTRDPPIAHRDLRSPNVFLMSLDDRDIVCAKVADFGLSVTQTCRIEGRLTSWQWVAPEVQLGCPYTKECDIYSFAIVCLETLRGQTEDLPFAEFFDDTQEIDLCDKIVTEHLRPSISSNVPLWMRTLMERMWQGDPRLRPSFAEALSIIESKGDIEIASTTKEKRMTDRFMLVIEEDVVDIKGVEGGGVCVAFRNSGKLSWFSTDTLKESSSITLGGSIASLAYSSAWEEVIVGKMDGELVGLGKGAKKWRGSSKNVQGLTDISLKMTSSGLATRSLRRSMSRSLSRSKRKHKKGFLHLEEEVFEMDEDHQESRKPRTGSEELLGVMQGRMDAFSGLVVTISDKESELSFDEHQELSQTNNADSGSSSLESCLVATRREVSQKDESRSSQDCSSSSVEKETKSVFKKLSRRASLVFSRDSNSGSKIAGSASRSSTESSGGTTSGGNSPKDKSRFSRRAVSDAGSPLKELAGNRRVFVMKPGTCESSISLDEEVVLPPRLEEFESRKNPKSQKSLLHGKNSQDQLVQVIVVGELAFCGYINGYVVVFSGGSMEILGNIHLNKVINKMCAVEQSVWVAAEDCIYRVSWSEISRAVVKELVMVCSQHVVGLLNIGFGEIWIQQEPCNVLVWHHEKNCTIRTFTSDVVCGLSCSAVVVIDGKTCVWIAMENEVLMFDRFGALTTQLTFPAKGTICLIEQVGLGSVWIFIKGEGVGFVYAYEVMEE